MGGFLERWGIAVAQVPPYPSNLAPVPSASSAAGSTKASARSRQTRGAKQMLSAAAHLQYSPRPPRGSGLVPARVFIHLLPLPPTVTPRERSSLPSPGPAGRAAEGLPQAGPRTPVLGPGGCLHCSCLQSLTGWPERPSPLRWVALWPLSRCHRWARDCPCTGPGSAGAPGGGSASASGGTGAAAQTQTPALAFPEDGGRRG